MLVLLHFFDLLESLFDCSHTDSIVEVVLGNNLASSLVWIVSSLLNLLVFVALHGEGLATSCLPVGKDGSMESVDNFVHQASDLKLIEDVLLGALFVKDFVENVVLASVVVGLLDVYLV